MPRRVMIALLLAGCASTQSSKPSPAPPPSPAPAPPPAAEAPRPAPAPRPPMPAATQAFDAWLADFRPRALAAGISPAVLDCELAGVTPDDKVSALDGRQPEFSRPIGAYLAGTVTADRISLGQQRRTD